MLTKITLENFKLFKSVTIEPALVTLLIGPNGTGKSSIIQALMLVKQVGLRPRQGERISFDGSILPLGSFEDVVHGRRNELKITVQIEVRIKGRLFEYRCTYEAPGVAGQPMPGFDKAINDLFETISFVRPLRGFDQSLYSPREDRASFTELSSPNSRAENAVTAVLLSQPPLKDKINKLAVEITGRGLVAQNAPQRQAFLAAPEGDLLTNIVHEGFGHNQLVELLLQLAEAKGGALLCIEEPEIHLHPKAQAALGRVLGREAKQRQVQLLMTTHSEHILMSFLTQVAKKELRSEDLAVYYFERTNDTATASRLEVNERGQLKGGLRGFFEADIEELDAYMKAMTKRETA